MLADVRFKVAAAAAEIVAIPSIGRSGEKDRALDNEGATCERAR